MLIPALITGVILGTLVLTRETEPSASALDAEMTRYGQLIAAGRTTEIDPGQLDALAAHLRKANRTPEAQTVTFWASYVRAVKRGVQPPSLPPGIPGAPQLPPAQTSEPAAAPLSPALQARLSLLTQQGEGASPFALEQLAGEIDRAAPGNYAAESLRALARANRALMEALRPQNGQAPVQGVPMFNRMGQGQSQGAGLTPMQAAPVHYPTFNLGTMRVPFSHYGVPFVPRSGLATPIPRAGVTRCVAQTGCAIMKTPGSLYPTGAIVPFMTAVNVQEEQGDWLSILYGTQRGWVAKSQFSSEFSTDPLTSGPGAPSVASASAANVR